jgi:hypothetical protein
MAEMPEYATEIGYPAGRITNDEVCELTNTLGKSLFTLEGICKTFFRPSIYLEHDLINGAGLNFEEVAESLATELSKIPGIGMAKSTFELTNRQQSGIGLQMKRNTHPDRSGDIYVAQDAYWFMFDKGPVAAMHGSPWRYDTHVPVIFSGKGIKPSIVNRLVKPADVAPTLSAILGIASPAGSQGDVLVEVVR